MPSLVIFIITHIPHHPGTNHINGKYVLGLKDNGEPTYAKQISLTDADQQWAGRELTLMGCLMTRHRNYTNWFISEA